MVRRRSHHQPPIGTTGQLGNRRHQGRLLRLRGTPPGLRLPNQTSPRKTRTANTEMTTTTGPRRPATRATISPTAQRSPTAPPAPRIHQCPRVPARSSGIPAAARSTDPAQAHTAGASVEGRRRQPKATAANTAAIQRDLSNSAGTATAPRTKTTSVCTSRYRRTETLMRCGGTITSCRRRTTNATSDRPLTPPVCAVGLAYPAADGCRSQRKPR